LGLRNESARLSTEYSATIAEILASTEERIGVVWSLQESTDLNVNLVQFTKGEGVGDHVNDEVDVLFVGVSGYGEVRINDTLHFLSGGTLILIPKGVRRSTRGISANFAYLTVHQRRGPLKIRVPRRDHE
jgi:quercetin dioxygenase-like cupin family protein